MEKEKGTALWKLTVFIAVTVLFFSCASKPVFSGKGDLCGLVVDENSKPVKDFVIYCESKSAGKKLAEVKPVLTNESGLFVFYDLLSGDYLLYGEKNNYLKIEVTPYSFNDRSKIICLQTKSFSATVKTADELFRLGQPESAKILLSNLSYEKESFEAFLITAWKIFLVSDENEKHRLIKELKKGLNNPDYRQSEIAFLKEFSEGLKEVIK